MSDLERMWNRFWFGFRLPASKINLLRLAFFGLLAADLFLGLEHAPRYGAGDFNVAHFAFLDAILPLPSRHVMVVLWLSGAYLSLRAAFGANPTLAVRILAPIYGYSYFCSQADAYQHHYLIFLLLVISCFVPWDQAQEQAAGARADGADDDPEVKSWALRLFVIQLALLYFWAAVTKTNDRWLDGSALHGQMSVDWVRSFIEWFGEPEPGDLGGYAVMAKLLLLGELFLAIALLWRRLWPYAWLVGMSFHVGVELAGFEIGLFSYFMIGIYVLFIPDRWLSAAAGLWRRGSRGVADGLRRAAASPVSAGIFAVLAIGGGALMMSAIGIESAGLLAMLVVLMLGAGALLVDGRRGGRLRLCRGAGAHLLACAILLLLHLTTAQVFSYYKFLAGTARRLGDEETMKMAYQAMVDRVAPGYGPAYYHLGNRALADGDHEAALDLYHKAQLRNPPDPRSYQATAQIYRGRGDEPAALDILRVCQRELPDRIECYVSEAELHRASGRKGEARAAATRALQIDPDDNDAPRARAVLQWADAGKRP